MLKWIAGKLNHPATETQSQVVEVTENRNAGGWYSPQTAETLLAPRARKQALQQLWDNSPFSRKVWETFWLEPVKLLAVRLQQLPAASTGPYAREGGMLDEALEVAVCAVRLSRGWMLPPGAPPEEQAAQSAAWCSAIFWAALFHDLGSLEQMAAFYEDGRRWYPGLEVPDAPWRVRFCEQTTNSEVRATALASRLLPYEGLRWVARWPQLTDALLVYLSGNKPAGAILHAAVSEARQKCGLLSQHTYIQPSVKSAADNPAPLSQIVPQEPAEHPTHGADTSPIVSTENNNNNQSQTADSATLISAVPSLVSALSQPATIDEDTEQGTDMPQEGATSGELLTLLDQMTGSEPTFPVIAPVTDISVTRESPPTSVMPDEVISPGEHFWNWLVSSAKSGMLSVNTQDSLLHVMSQYVFVQTPDCFYRYLAAQENSETGKDDIQKNFEMLNRHFSRNGKGIYIYRKYENDKKEGRFTKMSGYMVLTSLIFRNEGPFSDSPWLSPNK